MKTPEPSIIPLARTGPCRRVRALRNDLSACLWDGFLYCVMVGIGETYLAAFVLHLGLGPLLSGLVTTVPVVAGAFLQLAAPWAVRRLGSYPKFVAGCAYIQALLYVPFALLALFSEPVAAWSNLHGLTPLLGFGVFIVATLYWAVGLGCGPAWTTLVGEIIPARIRPHYFGKRNRLLQFGTLLGLLVHGGVMQWLQTLDPQRAPLASVGGSGWTSFGFACLFIVAGLCRLWSGYLLSTYSDPPRPITHTTIPLLNFATNRRGDSSFLLFVAAMGIATQIAQPFFNPFMLEKLRANPAWYSVLLASALVGKGLAQPFAAKWASRHGAARPLTIGALLLIPLPLVWLATDSFAWLLVGQLLSGAVWGMFELATFLRNFETTRPHERMSVLANFNCLNETAKTGGSLIGGRILGTGADPAYAWVFWASTAARGLAVLALSPAARRIITRPLTAILDAGPRSGNPGSGVADNIVPIDPPTASPSAPQDATPPSGRNSDR